MSKKLVTILIGLLSLVAISASASAADASDAAGWALFGLGLLCIIPIIIFIIGILIAIWVYRDAEKRGSSGVLWLIIVLLTSIVGLIIWLVVRPPIGGEKKEPERRCPNCGRGIPNDARVCPYCNKNFEQ